MINPKELLEAELKKLVMNFKNVLCRYEFHSQSDAHYVEINPSEQYNENSIRESMADIMYSFYDIFPNESLVFLTETDGISLDNPELTIKGEEYSTKWKCFTAIEDYLDFIQVAGDNNYALAA